MGDKTGISWTDATWNPIRGCSLFSEGCRHCYAKDQAARIVRMDRARGVPEGDGSYDGLVRLRVLSETVDFGATPAKTVASWTGEVRFIAERLADPLRWTKPRRIFVDSMSDLFHDGFCNEQIAAIFGVMAACPRHTFQVLTKRAKRMREWFEWASESEIPALRCLAETFGVLGVEATSISKQQASLEWPLPNVWIGVSVENQAAADERIPELLATPAAVRFLSCEPLLGPVDVSSWLWLTAPSTAGPWTDALGRRRGRGGGAGGQMVSSRPSEDIGWVIAGCESGPGARPCEVDWLLSLRDQCAAAAVTFFLKQAKETKLGVCGDSDNPNGDRPCKRPVTAYVIGPDTAVYSCGCTTEGGEVGAGVLLGAGEGSKRKPGGIIDLPYLDGIQHAAFPPPPKEVA